MPLYIFLVSSVTLSCWAQVLEAKAKAADEAAREARGMVLKEELRGRRRLLRKLGHTDRDFSVLLPKGQACVLRLS